MISEEVDESFKSEVLEILPDAVVWAKPVRNEEDSIVDFVFCYSNKKGDELIGHPKGSLKGLLVLKDCIPGDNPACIDNFQNLLTVYQTQETQEYRFYSAYTGLTVETLRRPFNGGVLSTTRDREAQREAEKKMQENTRLLQSIIRHAPAGIMMYQAIRNSQGVIEDFKIKLSNDIVPQFAPYIKEEHYRLTLKDSLKLQSEEDLFQRYVNTVDTGEPFNFENFYKPAQRWLSYLVAKLDDGFLLIVTDSTERKNNEQALEQQVVLTNSILDASLNGIYSLQAIRSADRSITDFRYLFVNRVVAQFLDLKQEDIIGKNMLDLLPENRTNGFFELFCRVLQSGKPVHEETHFVAAHLNHWFEYAIVKMNEDSLVVSLQDITQRKKAALQIEQQKNLLDNILQHSPSGITVTEVLRNKDGKVTDGRTIIANKISEQYLGLSLDQMLTKRISEIDPNILSSPIFLQALQTLETGNPFITEYYFQPAGKWFESSVARMDENRLISVFTDITVLKNVQLEAERAAERLSAVFNNAQSGMFTFAPVKDTKGEVVDFRFVITNPTFAAYVGQKPEVLNGALGSTWFPGYLHNGVFDMYKKTYLTGKTERTDIHYKVDQHDLYLDLMSTKIGEEVLVTFTDYTALKRTQLQMERYVEDLKRSNTNLEEFAYAASHDLKEPIRKIHFFSDRLKTSLHKELTTEQEQIFERMETAAQRMSLLIDDLLTYSRVSLRPRTFEEVKMNDLMNIVLGDLDLEIEQKHAAITVGQLFTVRGDQRQLQQAFQNIISNSLKYSSPGIAPEIKISCNKLRGTDTGLNLSHEESRKNYYVIEVSDNGIGFEQKDAERIFNVFQRLHGNSEYKGTGVGLSIVRKVVENHHGHIIAESEPGKGARFKIYLPAE